MEDGDLFCPQCGREVSTETVEPATSATISEGGDDASAQVQTGDAVNAKTPAGPTRVSVKAKVGGKTGDKEDKEKEELPAVPNYDVDNARPFVPECCPNCKTPEPKFDEDGFCTKCWSQTLLPGRDDFIIDNLGDRLLARSNRGTRHNRNEDYAALDTAEVNGKKVVWFIVCDGLSTSKNPQKASEAACKAASRVLRMAALADQDGSEDLIKEAINAAQTAVIAVPPEANANPEDSPPATTIVAAFIKGGKAYLGWCGDSRIYAIYKDGGEFRDKVLTHDHTLLTEKMEETGLSLKEAIASFSTKELHTMTQCLGEIPDGEKFEPCFSTLTIEENLVCLFGCSDGAWNDAHPMDAEESGFYAKTFKATDGKPKAFADAVLAKASGDDNNTIALVLM